MGTPRILSRTFEPLVLYDVQEQHPWTFQNLTSKVGKREVPLHVLRRKVKLPTADYTLEGHADRILVERKSVDDLVKTVGETLKEKSGMFPPRFYRELERMSKVAHSFVVCEGQWDRVIRHVKTATGFNHRSIVRCILYWTLEFPTIQWYFCPGRRFAEQATFLLFQRYWLNHR